MGDILSFKSEKIVTIGISVDTEAGSVCHRNLP